jgi:hypothetical protein
MGAVFTKKNYKFDQEGIHKIQFQILWPENKYLGKTQGDLEATLGH